MDSAKTSYFDNSSADAVVKKERGGWRSVSDVPGYDYSVGSNAYGGPGPLTNGVTMWFDEIIFYNYSDPERSGGTGHFTQLVWRFSTEVSCAAQEYSPGFYIFVCQCLPAGNVLGQFCENVVPLKPAYKSVNFSTVHWLTGSQRWASISLHQKTLTAPAVYITPKSTYEPVYTITNWAELTELCPPTTTSSNSRGSTIHATDRSTTTSNKSISSNSHGSTMNTTDRSTITSKKSTSSNSNGSTIDATDRSTTTATTSTSSNIRGSTIHAADKSTTTATTSTDYTKYALTPEEQVAIVLAHNKLRALHVDTGNLTWSNTLAE
ncbi:hypothetical protein RI543_000317 [Arxiozyma heterogenica]|uniref:SCP domain-containing protein n=1 Tax=Arxiozyma heterogenica TaxID=278026 RepID=A0AAN8A9P7_9SACH|nr:hypothetical protein RI543_000317 [Kazachstania heterogenica]